MPVEEEIHIWQFPLKTTYLLIESETQRGWIEQAIAKSGSMKKLALRLNLNATANGFCSNYGGSNICDWKLGRMKEGRRLRIWIPLWAVLEVLRLISCSEGNYKNLLERMELKVIGYKGLENGTAMITPMLPIRITPEFDSIVFHLMGDGCWGGKGKLSSYRQKNELGRNQFVRKLHNVFGYFPVNTYEAEEEWKVCIPSHIARIIECYYGIENYESAHRVPTKLFEKEPMHMLAGLSAFLVDEGNISDSIEIYASNEPLMNDLRRICDILGYSCLVSLKAKAGYRKHLSDHYRLRISLSSAKKLHGDLQDLTSKYPTCSLAQKQPCLDLIVRRQGLARKKGENGRAKGDIIKCLQSGATTVNEIKASTLIGGQTIRDHLNALAAQGRVKKSNVGKNAYHWAVINNP